MPPLDQTQNDSLIAMPLGDHLEELRRRIIWSLVGVVLAAVFTFWFGFHLIAWLAQPLLQAQDAMGFPPGTQSLEPTAGFTSVYLPVCLIAAVLLAAPWILFQAWRFVAGGLYKHERRAAHLLAPFSTVMVLLGVCFTSYLLLPVSLLFFLNFATKYPPIETGSPSAITSLLLKGYGTKAPLAVIDEGSGVTAPALPVFDEDPTDLPNGGMWINARAGKIKILVGDTVRSIALERDNLLSPRVELGAFVKFAANMILGVCIAFQLPVVMLVAGWSGLVRAQTLAPFRKYALFASFAAGALLTPTDLASMFVLAIPLYLLYELGLLIMAWAGRSSAPKDFPAET